MHLYSIFDSLAERWHVPYAMESDAVATRAFISSVPNSPMADSPGDFALFVVGHFDPETGATTGEDAPRRVLNAYEAIHVLNAAKVEDDKRQLKLA